MSVPTKVLLFGKINPGFSLVDKFLKAVNQPIGNKDSADHSLEISKQL